MLGKIYSYSMPTEDVGSIHPEPYFAHEGFANGVTVLSWGSVIKVLAIPVDPQAPCAP